MAHERLPGVLGHHHDELIDPWADRGPSGLDKRRDQGARWMGLGTPGPVGRNDASHSFPPGAAHVERTSRPDSPDAPANLHPGGPARFMLRYKNLRVPYVDPETGVAQEIPVSIENYNLDEADKDHYSNQAEMRELRSLVRREARRGSTAVNAAQQGDNSSVRVCFTGKASPQDFSTTLMHAMRFRRRFATPSQLQHYVNVYAKIGMDCSGLVCQYYHQLGRIPRPRNIPISSFEANGTLRTSPDQIQPLDVLTWQGDVAHIAMVDHIVRSREPVQALVVEASSSTDIAMNTYTFLRMNRDNSFRVDRGITPRQVNTVKVFSVPG